MILTVCMSPCVDVIIELDTLNVGKLNIVRNKSLSFTGKAINVAIGVARLGELAHATGFMYEDNGAMFEKVLAAENVSTSFVYSPGRVRENYKCIDKRSMLTEINDVGGQVTSDKLVRLLHNVRERSASAEVAVISGGLPKGTDPSYYRELFRSVDPHAKKIVDTEGNRLFSALEAEVDLVKPNLEELEGTLGRQFRDKDDMLDGCYELLERGARMVMLSLGKYGAVLTNGTKNFYCKSINVAVNSTVGAGDGMVAAVAVAMKENADMPELLRRGVAAGTASVTTFGSTSFLKPKFEEIYRGLTITEI